MKPSIETHTQDQSPYKMIFPDILRDMLGDNPPILRRNTLTCVSSGAFHEIVPNYAIPRGLSGPRPDARIRIYDGHVDPKAAFQQWEESLQQRKNHDIPRDIQKSASSRFNGFVVGDSFSSRTLSSSPNVPHPLLEYLPLYYLLKRFPILLACIGSIYAYRWDLYYPLQRRIPFSKKLRKIGIVSTWGEFLLWVPFAVIFVFGTLQSFVFPSVTQSGLVARVPLFICLLTASHNSLITLILGIPVERTIKYHKVSGYLAFLNGLFHTYVAYRAHQEEKPNDALLVVCLFEDLVNSSGTILLIIISSMIITSIPYVRRVTFEIFYYFHIIFAMSILGCAFYHSGIVVPVVGSIIWGGDVVLRKLYMAFCRNPRQAFIAPITNSVIEVRITKSKGFDYNPGQYVKICFPDISLFEWHPISISSSPYQHEVTLHIRTRGSWTKRLYSLSQQKKEVPILLEGPYGSLGVDLTSKRYSIVMLISGGIGVTPMQSIAHQLLYEHEWGERTMKKIVFIWTSRDPEVIENMDVSNTKSVIIQQQQQQPRKYKRDIFDKVSASPNSNAESFVIPSASKFLKRNKIVMLPPDFEETEITEKQKHMDGDDKHDDDDNSSSGDSFESEEEIGTEHDEQQASSFSSASPTAGSLPQNNECSEDILDLHCFVTSTDSNESDVMKFPFVHISRPDIKKLFLDIRQEAIRMQEKRVAVCICAPLELVKITRKACVKYSNRNVRFDFHYEVFE